MIERRRRRQAARTCACLLVSLGAALTALTVGPASPARADHPQPAFDGSQMDYTPIGHYGPAGQTIPGGSATIPNPSGGPPAVGPNPSGKWVAYDTNVWESLALPSRHPGDDCNSLPEEEQHPSCREGDRDDDTELAGGDLTKATGYQGPSGTPPSNPLQHGKCLPNEDGFPPPWGVCFNNQLEYLDYFEKSMKEMLGDFGVVVHRYKFHSPGRSDGTQRGGYLDGAGGDAFNISATVPGSDHPEETVLVSGHYDFTDSGPAAAWDSAEGHTEVMRMAWIMADYWRKTGTRPSATVKFIPWDSEESGTFGSLDYVENNIPPGEEDKVRGYFNVDPCAGAYPAYKEHTEQRVPQVLQVADPEPFMERDDEGNLIDTPTSLRIRRFNERAAKDTRPDEGALVEGPDIIDQVFDRLDDKLTRPGGAREPIFVSEAEDEANDEGTGEDPGPSQRGEVVTALGGLQLFSSDYANFEAVGIPIFNFFPDYFGPHADGTPASSEGIAILHTPEDNLARINRLTSGLATGNLPDPTGTFASEGWAKGQELCAQAEAHYMLQPEMGGGQTAVPSEVTAYFEALPNEALKGEEVTFDASGSHKIVQLNPRQTSDAGLTYEWDFGDGQTATGKTVNHAYAELGRYTATLTVSDGTSSDTMTIPVEVVLKFQPPELKPLDPENPDGSWTLAWGFEADRDGLQHFSVEESTDLATFVADDAEGELDANWIPAKSTDDPTVQGWQPSDSSTPKFRANQRHSGARAYWTGVSPQNFNPPPLNRSTTLTLNRTITVPATGDPEISYWSLFQNEGDDAGHVEVAIDDDNPDTPFEWEPVDVVRVVDTALGSGDPAVCDPSEPSTLTRGLENRRATLARFRGKELAVRFVYRLGPENRAVSQPCGWYIDDIRLYSGTWGEIATTPPDQLSHEVSGKGPGTYGYRVSGVYADGLRGRTSNVEATTVPGAPGGGPGGGAAPAAGVQPSGPEASRCQKPTGRARGSSLDRARLGRSRNAIRRAMPAAARRRASVDRVCLEGGGFLRIGYPSQRLLRSLSARERRRVRGEAVLLLTSSDAFSIHRIEPGDRLRTLRRRLRGERAIRVGSNVWYLAKGSRATLVFKVGRGRVLEVGLADRRLTDRRAEARRFLNSFR